jgi:hypothetical protein
VPQARPVARNDTVRTAQRAFFQAALNGVAATAPADTTNVQPKVQPVRAAAAANPQDRPAANLRPGSLLDIKV